MYVKTLGHRSWKKFYLMINETFLHFVLPKCLSAHPHWIPPPHWRVPGHDKTWSIAQLPHPLIQKNYKLSCINFNVLYIFIPIYMCMIVLKTEQIVIIVCICCLWNIVHQKFSFCFIDFFKNLSTSKHI